MSLLRRALPEIQEGVLTRHMADHEAATANIARLRVGNRQDKCRCYGGIHRIATTAQYLFGGLCGKTVGHGNRPHPRPGGRAHQHQGECQTVQNRFVFHGSLSGVLVPRHS
jgi:hypothetical protein